MSKSEIPLGKCKRCGANMDLVGLSHRCTPPPGMKFAPPIKTFPDPNTRFKLDEEKGHLVVDNNVAKKRGRPAKRTPEERKAFRAELMRKRRAEQKK